MEETGQSSPDLVPAEADETAGLAQTVTSKENGEKQDQEPLAGALSDSDRSETKELPLDEPTHDKTAAHLEESHEPAAATGEVPEATDADSTAGQPEADASGEGAFGSVIPDTETVAADGLQGSEQKAPHEADKKAPLIRTASLEVETGSLLAPESLNADNGEGSGKLEATEAAATLGSEADHSSKSAASEDGSVVIHSTPESSPQAAPEPVGRDAAGAAKAEVQSRSPPTPAAASVLRDPAPASSPITEREGPSEPPPPARNQPSFRAPDYSRTGVTASPPRSPKQDRPVETAQQSQAEKSEQPVSNGARPDADSLAEDLAKAEAEAEVAALAASQRNSSLGKQAAEELVAPAPEDAAAFTEEALQSDGRETTPSPLQGSPVRPFSPPPRGAVTAETTTEDAAEEDEAFEPAEFRGLIFHDGVDSLGRPVIVVNADAVAAKVSRKAACAYMLQRLEPIVIQGPYVLVLLNAGKTSRSNKLPAGWLASTYREMSYPFKKNVKHVILVRPSATLNFMLAIMRPLISKKAYIKLKKVDSLSAIAQVTNAEVTLQHLGPRFAASAGQSILSEEKMGQGSGYEMPNF